MSGESSSGDIVVKLAVPNILYYILLLIPETLNFLFVFARGENTEVVGSVRDCP